MNNLGIPGVTVSRESSVKCGITGTHITVLVNGDEEDEYMHAHHHDHDHHHEYDHEHEHHHDHDHEHEQDHHHEHDHEHDHDHAHTHHHSGMHDVEHILSHMDLTDEVRKDVMAVYQLIAEAESHAHGVPVTEIHFHEVGTMDAIADVTAVCLLMRELAPQRVVVSPVHVGSGTVRCAHGILPVPAPATAWILRDVPIYGGSIQGELCTPTGAALLRHFATEFGPMPDMRTQAIGYGMGKKDFPTANCVRAFLGETEDKTDVMLELSCNVDDMTAEEIGFAMDRLFEGGAREVYTVPIGMKKSRPGTLLRVICPEEERDAMVRLLFRHTSTIGVREAVTRRYVLDRHVETLETADGPVRRKISAGYGVERVKYEYDDLAKIAGEQGISLAEVRQKLEK